MTMSKKKNKKKKKNNKRKLKARNAFALAALTRSTAGFMKDSRRKRSTRNSRKRKAIKEYFD